MLAPVSIHVTPQFKGLLNKIVPQFVYGGGFSSWLVQSGKSGAEPICDRDSVLIKSYRPLLMGLHFRIEFFNMVIRKNMKQRLWNCLFV